MTSCFVNGHVFDGKTCSDNCFVVKDGRFVFSGTLKDAQHAFPDAQYIDLHGHFVCPGFNDSHMHLLNLGQMLMQAQLAPATDSLKHVLWELQDYVRTHPHEPFIEGRGWNQDYFTDECRYPTRDDLDHVCPDRPSLITRACGHVAVANSAALQMAGIDSAAPEVDGGRVVTDDSGRPNGVLEENAIELVTRIIPVPSRQQFKDSLRRGMQHVAGFGITSVQSDDFSSTKASFEEVLAAYLELKAEGLMTVRVYEQCLLADTQTLNRFLSLGYHTGWGDEWFKIGPLKLITDGSLGSRTALLKTPYDDAPDTCGIATYAQDALDEMILNAHRAGMQVAAHAIGDAAAERVLTSVRRAQNQYPRKDARHGIVHAQIMTQDQAKEMKELGMHAYIQPIFLDYDTKIVYPRLGSRADEAYPAKSLLSLGVTVSGGSDSPVEPPDVMTGIQCAVTRRPVTRNAQTPYLPHEALCVAEALRLFTADGAYASFEEDIKGQIRPGMLADFTILSKNPFESDESSLHAIRICETYVGGKATQHTFTF